MQHSERPTTAILAVVAAWSLVHGGAAVASGPAPSGLTESSPWAQGEQGADEAAAIQEPILASTDEREPVGVLEAASARVPAPLGPDPVDRVRAVGTPVPPSLPAARAKQRRTERAAALAELARTFDGRSGEPSLVQVLDQMLLDADIDDASWVAAAATAGDLRLTRLAPRIAAALTPESSPQRRAAARRALHASYGLWFDTPQSVLPVATLVDGPALTAYRERMLELETRLLDELARLWTHRPQLALEALNDASPRARGAAARAIERALGAGSLDVEVGTAALLAATRVEADDAALCAMLEALTPSLQVRASWDERVADLRELLAERVENAPTTVQHAIARVVAALPWERPESDDPVAIAGASGATNAMLDPATSAQSALALTRRALRRVAESRPLDPDVVVGVLQCERAIAHTYGLRGLPGGDSASAPILSLFDRPDASREVRLAAAAALTDLAGPQDVEAIVARVHGTDDFALRFAFTGALASVAPELDATSAAGRALFALLAELVGDGNEEQLRLRALAVLDTLTADVGREDLDAAGMDTGFLLERWRREKSIAARATIDGLVRRLGRARDIENLLQNDGFADVARFGARQAAAVVADIASTERDTSAQLELHMQAARALASIDAPAQLEAALVEALTLGVGVGDPTSAGPRLDGGEAGTGTGPGSEVEAEANAGGDVDVARRELDAARSAEFVTWALDLRALTGTLSSIGRPVGPDGAKPRPVLAPAVLGRLLGIHVPNASIDQGRRLLAEALFSIDQGRGPEGALSILDTALAANVDDPVARVRLLRERARLHQRSGNDALALADYRHVFAEHEGGRQDLDRGTLLDFEALLGRALANDAAPLDDERRRELETERARVLLALLERPWPDAAAERAIRARRMIDLMASARASDDPALAARAAAAYDASDLTSTDAAAWENVEDYSDLVEALQDVRLALGVLIDLAERPSDELPDGELPDGEFPDGADGSREDLDGSGDGVSADGAIGSGPAGGR